MLKVILAAALSIAVIAAAPAVSAQTTTSEPAKAASEKKLTPQQQKMKDCGAKWQDYKKANNVKGRDAYRKFQKDCLKG
jgi:curli biogenesis system outer membrane secretion channel CsgG